MIIQVEPYCDELMELLVENLSNDQVNRAVKPAILAVFGDMALAIGLKFTKYLTVVLQMLQQASQAQVTDASPQKVLVIAAQLSLNGVYFRMKYGIIYWCFIQFLINLTSLFN